MHIIRQFIVEFNRLVFTLPFINVGLEFAYSQAPASMKSCLQAAWLMTVAFGNLIVVIEAESHLFTNPMTEFFFFAAMLFVVMLVFVVMSVFYQYVESPSAGPSVPIPVDMNDDRMGILDMDELAQI